MKEAAKNPGAAGSAMGTGLGFGLGVQMTEAMRGAAGDRSDRTDGAAARGAVCAKCGAPVGKAKFCPECGAPVRRVCAKCGAELGNAKFCPECGEKA